MRAQAKLGAAGARAFVNAGMDERIEHQQITALRQGGQHGEVGGVAAGEEDGGFRAEKTDPTGPYYVLWEARVRLKMGDKQGAATAAQHGVDLAKAAKDDEYTRLNQAVLDKAKE